MSRSFAHAPFDFGRLSPAIRLLVAANLAAFGLAWLVGPEMSRLFGLVPSRFLGDRWVWQAATYLFIHGNFVHLLFNLFALWMFAVPVEAQWGPREFLKYYLLCGVGAGVLSALLQPSSSIPIVGASGAIYGLLVAFAMLYPEAVVYLYFFFPVKARDMAILFGLIEFFAGAASASPGVARVTHLSGMLIGYFYIRWWWIVKLRAKALWFETVGRSYSPPGRSARRPRAAAAAPRPEARPESADEVDRILDKISASGRESLTREELELLRRASRFKMSGEGDA